MIKAIPAIDLYDGQVVRLKKGDYNQQTTYSLSPLEQAKVFKQAGFNHIHVVDLNGAKEGKFVNLNIIREIHEALGLSVQTGGGVRSFDDVQRLIDHGISGIICSSMVVKNEPDWKKALKKYPEEMILGLDLKDGKMAYGGWLETSDQSISSFIKPYRELGLQTILSTDIARDGMLQGPNFEMYRELAEIAGDIKIVASGGVASKDDLTELDKLDLYGVVVGKAYYEQKISIQELAAFSG